MFLSLRKTEPTRSDPPRRVVGALGALLATACSVSGCVQEMANQPRVEKYEHSTFFVDGMGIRPQVAGTLSRDDPWDETPEITGRDDGQPLMRIPIELTDELLERGRQRFGIFCAHCHGWTGYGDGMVVQRGFPAPPSYHSERLRSAPDGHIFAVISDGLGRMPALGSRMAPRDRWAIAAYVRALQLSQIVAVDELDKEDRAQLQALPASRETP